MTTDAAEETEVMPAALVPVEAGPPPALIEAEGPADLVIKATAMANTLAPIIEKQKLFLQIGQKKHVYVEGWTTLGAMVGAFAHVEWTRPVDGGWEARVVVRTMAGVQVGAAEAQCTGSERNWNGRDDFALRSMAQTRATSKALRMPLGWIIQLAGYSPTPAEDIDTVAARPARRPAGIGASDNDAPMSDKQRTAIRASLGELFDKDEQAAFAWMQTIEPKACQGTEIHLTGLTGDEAGRILTAANDERASRNGN